MSSFKMFGGDDADPAVGVGFEFDEGGDLAFAVWGLGTGYLQRDAVIRLRDHLTDLIEEVA